MEQQQQGEAPISAPGGVQHTLAEAGGMPAACLNDAPVTLTPGSRATRSDGWPANLAPAAPIASAPTALAPPHASVASGPCPAPAASDPLAALQASAATGAPAAPGASRAQGVQGLFAVPCHAMLELTPTDPAWQVRAVRVALLRFSSCRVTRFKGTLSHLASRRRRVVARLPAQSCQALVTLNVACHTVHVTPAPHTRTSHLHVTPVPLAAACVPAVPIATVQGCRQAAAVGASLLPTAQ